LSGGGGRILKQNMAQALVHQAPAAIKIVVFAEEFAA
jgi:hypothetical protein